MLDDAHALVVGIAGYRHVEALPDTVLSDARDLHAVLVDPDAGGYPPANARLLLDGEATRDALLAALADLAARAGPASTVLVALSCHGAHVEAGPHAGEYLLPVEAEADSPDALARTAISGADLAAALHAIPARSALVVLDCCHAGGLGQPLRESLPDRYYASLGAGRGRALLASSRSTERSWILPGAGHSLFTEHLIAGLRGGVAGEDGMVRVLDLFEYAQPRVTAEQPEQHPVLRLEVEENFPVALRLGGLPAAPEVDPAGFRYDVYVSFVDRAPDSTWVWNLLVPRLEAAGLRVAVSGDVEAPGVARVVGVERAVTRSRRTVVVLSPRYLDDGLADFENVLAQTIGVEEGTYRLLPVVIEELPAGRLPARLRMLTALDLTRPARADRALRRLLDGLLGPLPRR